MCVALVLILNNFYKYYDTLLSICEHITAALLLLISVSLIVLPVLFINTKDSDPYDNVEVRDFNKLCPRYHEFPGVVHG